MTTSGTAVASLHDCSLGNETHFTDKHPLVALQNKNEDCMSLFDVALA